MSIFLRIIGGILAALGTFTCFQLPMDKMNEPVTAGTAATLLFLMVLPGIFVYLWGARIAKKDAAAAELLEELRRQRKE